MFEVKPFLKVAKLANLQTCFTLHSKKYQQNMSKYLYTGAMSNTKHIVKDKLYGTGFSLLALHITSHTAHSMEKLYKIVFYVDRSQSHFYFVPQEAHSQQDWLVLYEN